MFARLDSVFPLEDASIGARFLWRLPSFLRHPISAEQAKITLRRRLERREGNFMALARQAIYAHAASPYRQLLNLAGCEYGDLERLVGQEGVEGALRTLYRQGVYLTVDEFKGRRPVVRGNATIEVESNRLCNPLSAIHVSARSSGSRGAPIAVGIDFAHIRDCAINQCLTLDARGGIGWLHAIWGLPGGGAMVELLRLRSFGIHPPHWFSLLDPATPGLHPRYRWSAHLIHWGSVLARVPLPHPRYVPFENPLPIVYWMMEVLRQGGTPHLLTSASAAVGLCRAAFDAGADLRGAQFCLGGEPITEARVAVVRRVGAQAMPAYQTSEAGFIGYGCLAPQHPDEIHLFNDLHAVIQPGLGREQTGLPSLALLVSSVRATAPLILLNVSLGDQAVVGSRACGCPLERLGWITHLHTIRSYEKLTAGGMTFLDTDVMHVLDEVLPTRFGGGPTDYQLLEEETDDGRACLRLVVHPRVGPLDTDAVAETFLTAIGHGSGGERVMGLLWRAAGLLRVERREPKITGSGKIHHLHVQRSQDIPPPTREQSATDSPRIEETSVG